MQIHRLHRLRRSTWLFIPLLGAVLAGCGADSDDLDQEPEEESYVRPVLPAVAFDYSSLPRATENFVDRDPASNPVSNAGATLGRVLFYDRHLSANNTTACGSCHFQKQAFTDGKPKSIGFQGGMTKRNALSVVNLRYQLERLSNPLPSTNPPLTPNLGGFFWDVRASTLEQLALQPIQDPIELGSNLQAVTAELQRLDYYPALFQSAFGTPEVTSSRISLALAQFLRSIVSVGSKLDVGRELAGSPFVDFPNFTAQENEGKRLFITSQCAVCHSLFALPSGSSFSNGLELESTVDRGIGENFRTLDPVTGQNLLDGEFRAPALRNIELTAPYMHDGSLATLEDVVEHYNSRIQPHRNLTPILEQDGQPRRLNLNAGQKAALVAFLKTFTDHALLNDPKFSDPFPAQ